MARASGGVLCGHITLVRRPCDDLQPKEPALVIKLRTKLRGAELKLPQQIQERLAYWCRFGGASLSDQCSATQSADQWYSAYALGKWTTLYM